MRSSIWLGTLTLLLSFAAPATACPRWGHGKGSSEHGRGLLGCVHMMMHAPGDKIKGKLGLSEEQTKRLQAIHDAFSSAKVTLEAEIAKAQLAKQKVMREELPNERAALATTAKLRAARGKLIAERIKTAFKVLKVLSKEQRAKLRQECTSMWGKAGKGKGFGAGGPGCGWGGPNAGPGGCPGCGRPGGCPFAKGGQSSSPPKQAPKKK